MTRCTGNLSIMKVNVPFFTFLVFDIGGKFRVTFYTFDTSVIL